MANQTYKSKYNGEQVDTILDYAKDIKVPEVPKVINDLNSTSEKDALSANMGREINEKIPNANSLGVTALKCFVQYGYTNVEPSDLSLFSFSLSSDGTTCSVKAAWDKTDETVKSVTVPYEYDGVPVTTLNTSAFEGYTYLQSVRVPACVNTYGNNAFNGCTSLTNVTHIDSGSNFAFGSSVFSGCTSIKSTKNVDFDKKSGDIRGTNSSTFNGCTGLTEVTFPVSMSAVPANYFKGCTSLTAVTLPDNFTYVQRWAFKGCTSLKEIYLPTMTDDKEYEEQWCGKEAFAECTSLTDIYYAGTEEEWNSITIASGNECLTNATIHFNWKSATKNELEAVRATADEAEKTAEEAHSVAFYADSSAATALNAADSANQRLDALNSDLNSGSFIVQTAYNADKAAMDEKGNFIHETYATKAEVGEIDTALDAILEIQNSLIGGEGE